MSKKTTAEPKPKWTVKDCKAAAKQGWGIFETVGRSEETEKSIVNGKPYGHRPYELQRDDEAGVFNDDDAAHKFVRKAAKKGDELATRALAYLKAVSPLEYEAVLQD